MNKYYLEKLEDIIFISLIGLYLILISPILLFLFISVHVNEFLFKFKLLRKLNDFLVSLIIVGFENYGFHLISLILDKYRELFKLKYVWEK